MTRLVLCMLSVLALAGCAVNDSPLFLYMTQDELQHAIDRRYCAGMPAEDVIAQMGADGLTHFVELDEEGKVHEIEARLVQAGLQRETNPQFGRLLLRFDQERLESIRYGSPIDDGLRWSYTRYRIEPCEATGIESGVTP